MRRKDGELDKLVTALKREREGGREGGRGGEREGGNM